MDLCKKQTLLLLIIGLMGCRREKPEDKIDIQMTAFEVLNEREFAMCFNNYIPAEYRLVIVTHAGFEIEREGTLEDPIKGAHWTCFKERKTKFSLRSHFQKRLYYDSISQNNIASVRWSVYRHKRFHYSGGFKVR
jgi:hypothetical protein